MSSEEAVNNPTGGRERRLANLKPFQKGQSGNPSGVNKRVKAVEEEAKENAEAAFKQLVKLVKSKDERVALQASIAVLDRALGKPKQTIASTITKRTLEELSTDDLIAALQSAADSNGTAEAEAGNREPDNVH